MIHVLVLSLTFPPDNVSTAHLMGELASDLVDRDHKVTVMTTRPHFNRDAAAEDAQPINSVWGRLLGISDLNGATVYHTPVISRSGGVLNRLTGWMIFHLVSLIAGLLLLRRVDVILAPSPPLTIGLVAWILGLRHRAKFIYNVQELYPDIAVSLGVIRNKAVVSLLYRFERFVYATAGRVTVISSAMHARVLSKGVPGHKVLLIPNWVDTSDISILPKDNEFSREHGVHQKFVVSYAGNMGLAQSFDELLEAAEILRNSGEIRFMLIGDGVERENIKQRLQESGLNNVIMLPYQPYHLVPQIYASSDLSYVPLHGTATTHALPSKLYRIMASGRTILALAERDSGIADLVIESGAGILVEPGSGRKLATEIERAASDPARIFRLGEIGREFVVNNYSRSEIVERYVTELTALAGRHDV